MQEVALVYALGVLIGLWRTDGPPAARASLALLWPLGPLALCATLGVLLMAAAIAFSGPRRRH